ncbi:MAG: tetratricopeptide repeat protein, partial [Candidatus Omnitrophica bacterium]|nr:tetratricopeptide repeat protein [Candidatus Omnitrophota bacterium]
QQASLSQKKEQEYNDRITRLTAQAQELDKLKDDNRRMAEEKQALLSQVSGAQKQIVEQAENVNVIKKQALDKEREYHIRLAELTGQVQELSRLNDENRGVSEEKQVLLAQIETLKIQAVQQEERTKLAEQALRDKELEYAKKLENSKLELSEQVKELYAVADEKRELLAQINELKKQADEREKRIDLAATLLKDKERDYLAKLASTQSELSGQVAELTRVRKENSALAAEKQTLLGKVETFKKQISDLEQKTMAAEKTLRDKEKEYIAALENNKPELNAQLKKISNLAEELDKKNQLVNKDKELYLSQIEDYKNKYAALQEKFKTLEQNKAEVAKQAQALLRKERDWENKDLKQIKLLSEYSDTVDKLKTEIGKLESAKRELELHLKSIPNKLAELERDVNALRRENNMLHYNLGVFYTQRQEYTLAIDEFNKALKLNANDASTHYNLGIIYSRYIIDETKAVSHFKHYLALAPNDKDATRAKEYLLIWGAKDDIR